MNKLITIVLPVENNDFVLPKNILESSLIKDVIIISSGKVDDKNTKYTYLENSSLSNSTTLIKLSEKINSLYTMFVFSYTKISIEKTDFYRFVNIANETKAGFIYSDYYEIKGDEKLIKPTIDYQTGSIRDDFHFGPINLVRSSLLKSYISYNSASQTEINYNYAGFYDLRLFISRHGIILRIPEYLYSHEEVDNRKSGEKQFDYVDPKNRDVQLEMEEAATEHLKKINAFLTPDFDKTPETNASFHVKASVIIPVKNRETTIKEAVASALSQKTDFPFNIIVVDNYSTDNTSVILEKLCSLHDNIIHVIPQNKDLGIGGCWNEGITHEQCGMYAVQLDSDDLYIDENVLQKIIHVFNEDNCAMVIGSYTMTNSKLEELPPGLIDHKEWTWDNGRNNALRINGLGAPRAFYVPVLRKYLFPNVSYGEDYSTALAISRRYKISRIYESLYLCRRWEGNTDSDLTAEQVNKNNYYKDRVRTIEIITRQKLNELEQ